MSGRRRRAFLLSAFLLLGPFPVLARTVPRLPGLVPSNPFLSEGKLRPALTTLACAAAPTEPPGEKPFLPKATVPRREEGGRPLHQPRLVPVLTFHDLGTRFEKDSIITPADRFSQMMHYLQANRYQTFFASEIPALLRGRCERLRRGFRPVVLTFDDGYVNNYNLLLPILRKFDARATIFLIVSKIVERRAWSRSNALTWFEVRKMSRSGHVEFGSHTFALHYDLARLERLSGGSKRFRQQVFTDLYTSRAVLESELGVKVRSLAWPHGKRSKGLKALARQAGFSLVFNTHHAVIQPSAHDPSDLPRLNTSTPYMTASALHRRLQESLIQAAWAEKVRSRRLLARGGSSLTER